ncbi:hypothetical protein GA0061083_3435 [Pseudarthrobacter enclensis]|uniref:Uncharacterized protein n=1 Tax=Pseudarthrobacter enclensis TaxID=993070 RepID=A0A0V8IH52_9MICC|nr:hypothetical protein [Pseudarthrobacter enclensis]KSU74056.1 hypothetical protein AS031_15425 [Pseudarthrobacter enclensis]SCC21765.1 hypothetical protein GA0061083_3435 [Pseudarthrobacter enclensis]
MRIPVSGARFTDPVRAVRAAGPVIRAAIGPLPRLRLAHAVHASGLVISAPACVRLPDSVHPAILPGAVFLLLSTARDFPRCRIRVERLALPILAAGTSAAATADVGIYLVGLAGVTGDLSAQLLRLMRLLLGFLPQPGGVDLRLLGVRTRTGRLGFPLTGVDFLVLRFPADLGCLFPVLLIALLLHGLPAPPTEKEQQNSHDHHNGDHYPYP